MRVKFKCNVKREMEKMVLMPAEGQEPRRIIILHNPQWEIQTLPLNLCRDLSINFRVKVPFLLLADPGKTALHLYNFFIHSLGNPLQKNILTALPRPMVKNGLCYNF